MLTLFTKEDNISYPIKTDPNLIRVSKVSNIELKKVKTYIRSRNSRVNNSNIIAKIIDTLDIDINMDLISYLNILDNRATQIAKQFNISTTISKGKLLHNQIYKNSNEIFIYIDQDIDPFTIEDNWRDISPLKLLKHDTTDLKLSVPEYDNNIFSDYIFSIDIKLLLLTYKYWALNRVSNDMSIDSTYFIYQYVYSNMLDSYFHISVLNRLIYKFNNITIVDTVSNYPFAVRDLSRKVDTVLDFTLKNIKNKNMKYNHLLKYIPNILDLNSNYKDILLNKQYFNNNNYWVYLLSKLEYMLFFINVLNKNGLKQNKDLISDLKIDIKTLKRNHYLDSGYKEIYDNKYLDIINDISNEIGVR